MRRSLWSLVILALLMTVGLPAQAQEEWTCFYDFTASDDGWETGDINGADANVTRNSSGWNDGLIGSGLQFRGVDIQTTFSGATTITRITVDHTRIAGTSDGGTDIHVAYSGSHLWWTLLYYEAPDEPLVITSAPTTVAGLGIRIFSGLSVGGADPGGSVVIRSITLQGTGTPPDPCEEIEPPEGELTRPLQPADRLFAFQSAKEPIPDIPQPPLAHNAVIFAAQSNSLVSAVIGGTITEIETLDPQDCEDLFTPATDFDAFDGLDARDLCRVTLTAGPVGAGNYVHLFSQLNNPATAYLIHIDGDDGREYLQIATDVQNYAYEGQTVSAGCYLGKVLEIPGNDTGTVSTIVGLFNSVAGALIQIFGEADQPFEALTAVWIRTGEDSYFDGWSEYTLDPSDSAPCNSPEGYEGCMGDSRLEDASQWQSSNGVSWLQPGAMMDSGSFIRATFNLDADREPKVIVGAFATPLSILAVTLGTNYDPINYVLGTASFEVEAGDPDSGDFYTVELKNTGQVPTRIDFICVIHNDQEPTEIPRDRLPPDIDQAPGTRICYFKDSSFEGGLDEWDQTGDVEEDDGVLLLPDDATIEQDLKLKAGTYTLKVIARVWSTGAYSPDDDDDSNGIEIEYAYPGSTFVTVGGMKSWGAYAVKGVLTLSATIVVASDEDGPFTLRANVVLPPTGVLGAQLTSACLTKEGDVEGGDGDGLIEPTCGAIPTPTLSATAPGTWFTWLWAQSNKFFRCELIKVINAMHSTMTRFFNTILWTVRWTQASVMRAAAWANTTLYWLNGHLYNVAVGQIYTVEGGEGFDQSGDIGDVLLGGLKSVIDLFIDLLQRVIDFVFYLLNLVFVIALDIVVALIRIGVLAIGYIISLLGQFFDLINAMFFAWNNADAVAIAGVPQCAVEPKENTVCIMLWTLENTIFSGRGFLFIPFMIAYGSAELLLWAITHYSKTARDSAQGG